VKVEIPIVGAQRLVNAGSVVLVTTRYRDRVNVMTASWATAVSGSPPLVGVSVHRGTLTHDLMVQSEEFVLNIPWVGLAEQVKRCGELSGWEVEDKLQEVGLTAGDATYIEAPIIEECIGHLECAVVRTLDVNDHTFFVGQIVAAQVEEDAFDDESWVLEEEELKPLQHIGGRYFGISSLRFIPPYRPPEAEEEE
jgi:flavin reductase (DIM6/NTAB) family NADH-FMN oxidoreductase RutF